MLDNNTKLKMEDGRYLYFNKEYLDFYKQELLNVLDGQDYMQSLKFAKKMMMSQEIKANNTIEGIKDDLSVIDEVIKKIKSPISERERKRIINLFHGYQYILNNSDIDKDNLRRLYDILSDGILLERDRVRMGEYYRSAPVYILKGNRLDVYPYMGMDSDKIDDYMDQFFAYANRDDCDNEMDVFIKSQIMHFYFVYIHPYFDVNGRTSRTVSMWYLLNHESYPYIIFNRAVSFAQRKYEQNIVNARNTGNATLFLKYMLVQVEKELEKEYLIHSIKESSGISFNKEQSQMLEYLLTMKGNITAKDLSSIYNNYNAKRRVDLIFDEKIYPLLEMGILVNKGDTKGFITNKKHNMNLGINKKYVKDVDPQKVKNLQLDKYI